MPGTFGTITNVPAGNSAWSPQCGLAARKAACACSASAGFKPCVSNTCCVNAVKVVGALVVMNCIIRFPCCAMGSGRDDVERRPRQRQRVAVDENLAAADVAQHGER